MKKYHYAIIGNPIGHTMSPFIHSRLFEIAGIDADYNIIEIKPEHLKDNMPMLNRLEGYNVTIPHKVAVTQYLDKMDKKAKFYGAVNTVKNSGFSKGYITDVYGFLSALKTHGIALDGKVVIIGSGGAAKVIACEMTVKGCNPIIAVRPQSLRKAAELASVIRERVVNMEVETCRLDRLTGPIDLLINATPAGMYPDTDGCPLPENIINQCRNVMDLIYNPLETKLMRIAKANGANVINGLSMLIWQAVKAQEIWNNVYFNNDDIMQLCEDTKKELCKR